MEASDARITVRQKGSVVPIVEHAVHRSPALASRGLLIEHHAHEKAEFPRREPESHIIYLHTGASVQADIEGPGVSGTRWFRPGMVWVMPEGSEHAVRFHGKVEGIGVSFAPEFFSHLLASADAALSRQVEERIVADQPKLEHLMRALWCESLEPTEPGLLAAECIAAALALTLTQPRKNAQQHAPSGLTGWQLRTILCFVKSHISEPMSLRVLADLVGLSPYHFLRSFKRSTGITPHQYVLEQRIEAAKQLLRSNNQSIAEVSATVGFAHQSHFARAFRKCVGAAPSEFVTRS